MTKLWWLSFADDTGFLGACIAEGEDMKAAIRDAWAHRINPGGSVKGYQLDRGREELRPFVIHKLYSKDEINEIDEAVSF